MKAENTVMSDIEVSERIQYFPDWDLGRGNQFIEELCKYIAMAQAEISFKAGIKEVVEWVEKNSLVNLSFTSGNVRVVEEFAWQSQKEMWRL